MAGRALTRARLLRRENEPVIGLACTAAIVTDRPKKGTHRAHITTWQNEQVVSYTIVMDKGLRNRDGEESLVSQIMLNALANAYGLEERLEIPLSPGDKLTVDCSDIEEAATLLRDGSISFFGVNDVGQVKTDNKRPPLLLPGSFNPLHDGHLQLGRVAAEITGQPIAFELSAYNVDKPPLPVPDILDRIAQFAGRWPIFTSNAPTFLGKAKVFPGATFVVGFDTAVRIMQPRYYNNSDTEMREALDTLDALGCKFMVAGRVDKNGQFQEATELPILDGIPDLFIPIAGDKFRRDISSSELRKAGKRGSR